MQHRILVHPRHALNPFDGDLPSPFFRRLRERFQPPASRCGETRRSKLPRLGKSPGSFCGKGVVKARGIEEERHWPQRGDRRHIGRLEGSGRMHEHVAAGQPKDGSPTPDGGPEQPRGKLEDPEMLGELTQTGRTHGSYGSGSNARAHAANGASTKGIAPCRPVRRLWAERGRRMPRAPERPQRPQRPSRPSRLRRPSRRQRRRHCFPREGRASAAHFRRHPPPGRPSSALLKRASRDSGGQASPCGYRSHPVFASWCNGSTADSESACLGSSPSEAAP
jgi:hypothetical protein